MTSPHYNTSVACCGIALLLQLVCIVAKAPAEEAPANETHSRLNLSTPLQGDALASVVKEAFSRLGIQITVSHLPAERSLIAANSGIHDGELARIAGLETLYPNLTRVDESIGDYTFVAFTKGPDFKTTDWSHLVQYRVGIIKGWKILESNLKDHAHIIFAYSPEQLFTLLDKARIDIALFEERAGLTQLEILGIDEIRVLHPPLAKQPLYVYLHKRHRALVPSVAEALRTLKADGTHERIFSTRKVN